MNEFLNEKIMPKIVKFINTKAIQSLKDGMIYIMPVLIVGSFFLLIANLPFKPLANFLSAYGIDTILMQVYGATYEIMAMIVVLGITYTYVNKSGYDGFTAAVIAFAVFIIMLSSSKTDAASGVTISGVIPKIWTSAQGMVCAILIAFYVSISYCWFLKRNIRIKLPESVPENIANSFSALIPGSVIIIIATVVFAFFDKVLDTTIFEWVYKIIQAPLQGMTDSLGGMILISLAIPFLWIFGVHGSSIVNAVVVPFLRANLLDNQALLEAGKLTLDNGAHIVTEQFYDNIFMMTGSGITIGIAIYLAFMSKSKQCKDLGKLSFLPSLFNINEPIMFAVPVVFNPIMAVPFLLTPLVSGLVSYFAIYTGLVPFFTGVVVPWTTPPVISGFILGGWRMALLQVVVIILSTLIYLPFIRKVDLMNMDAEKSS